MNKLIVLSGVPGSGKSYFSHALQKAKGSHIYLISSDGLRKIILGTQKDLSNEKLVWSIFYDLAKVYSQDKDGIVVLDATNYSRKRRIDDLKEIKSLFDQLILVCFELNREQVIAQNKDREFALPDEVMNQFFQTFQTPDEKDQAFYDEIIILKDHDYDSIISKLTQ